MALDISSLEKAENSLKDAWNEYQKNIENTFVRDSVVQRFEYTYELSFKMIKRELKEAEAEAGQIDQMFFADIIRSANEKGFLRSNLEKWALYRGMRNITSHAYDSGKADQVISIIPDFIDEADFLIAGFKQRRKDEAGSN